MAAQQGPAVAPHLTQVRSAVVGLVQHTVVASVHAVPDVQQPWFSLPHSHFPELQVPASSVVGITQAAAGATQRPDEQQPPPLHMLSAQQGLPAIPHGRQVLFDVSHRLVASVHRLPGQHGSPGPPQRRHWLVAVEQTVLASLHVLPTVVVALIGQHNWPAFPHAQDPAEQLPKLVVEIWQD